jgi:HEPN domain-containing protein
MLNVSEYFRWTRSAYKTLESAERDMRDGDYNWSCFKVHQAAEKAIKAVLWGVGKPKSGHSLVHLLQHLADELRVGVPEEVKEACIVLSKFYIPTRYPDV